jgi:hypothetical protein
VLERGRPRRPTKPPTRRPRSPRPHDDEVVPKYVVTWFHSDDHDETFLFEGEGSFARSMQAVEAAKLDPHAVEIWVARLDGSKWKFVGKPIRRNADGEWEEADD